MSKKERTLKRTYNRNVKKIVKSEAGMMIQSLKLENVELIGKLRVHKILAVIGAVVSLIGLSMNIFFVAYIMLKGF